jgi:hypothetical protein
LEQKEAGGEWLQMLFSLVTAVRSAFSGSEMKSKIEEYSV